MMESNSKAVGIIGSSGSGKTRYLRGQLAQEKETVYVVNGSEDEYPSESYCHVELEDVLDLDECAVVIEDLISPSPKNQNVLNQLLKRNWRHSKLRLYIVSHGLYRNNSFNFVSLYTHCCLTRCAQNKGTLKKVCNMHDFEEEDWNEIWSMFMNQPEDDFVYLVLNLREKSWSITLDSGLPPTNLYFSDLCKRIKGILSSVFEGKRLHTITALLDHIFAEGGGLPRNLVNMDLSISLRGEESGEKIDVSLVDFLACITDDANPDPDYEVQALFEFISSKVKMPKLLIKNKNLTD